MPTPEPVAIGEPGSDYPLPWSVQTWLPGTVATDADPGRSRGFAADLAELVAALRTPREVLRERLGCGDLEWQRGMAWAFQQSMGAVWYYVETNPTMSLMGRRTLTRLLTALT